MLLEVRALQVAPQQIAGTELADPQVGRRGWLLQRGVRSELLALYLQLSAPFRHT